MRRLFRWPPKSWPLFVVGLAFSSASFLATILVPDAWRFYVVGLAFNGQVLGSGLLTLSLLRD